MLKKMCSHYSLGAPQRFLPIGHYRQSQLEDKKQRSKDIKPCFLYQRSHEKNKKSSQASKNGLQVEIPSCPKNKIIHYHCLHPK
jgi:hypothetical protein